MFKYSLLSAFLLSLSVSARHLSSNYGKCGWHQEQNGWKQYSRCQTAVAPYCSEYGYCGSSVQYQNNGQTEYDYCDGSSQNETPNVPQKEGGCGIDPDTQVNYGRCQTKVAPYCSSAGYCGSSESYWKGGQDDYNYQGF